MTVKELLRGVWFWFVALFAVPAFAGWLGYFAHVVAEPHFSLETTAMAWAFTFALLALLPWIVILWLALVLLMCGGR